MLFRKIMAFFKNLFKKEEEIKLIEAPKNLINDKMNFLNSLKVYNKKGIFQK